MPPHLTTTSPRPARRRARRLRRATAAAASIGAVMMTTAGTGHADPYAAPVAVPRMAPSTLDVRYAAERRSIEAALRTAEKVGDTDRRRALGAFLQPGRRFLYFDPRGRGRAIEVIGDLARARRIAVLVPGADTTLAAFDKRGGKPWSTPGGGARAVYRQARSLSPEPGLAVVAWLGYAAPKTFSGDVLTAERAAEGAVRLRTFMKGVHQVNPGARVGLLCHSYGSVVCGRAALGGSKSAAWRQVTDIALYGSPGTTAWSASRLSGSARVWAGRGSTDWMEDVPHVRFLGLGLGPDPVSTGFGARVFDAGHGGHSDYLAPGSAPLRNLTDIALGRVSAVTPD
ncbi:alpha/beta hydrolase [Actinomadura mexicana]|uniref:Alpha/beta hydrolase n=1 Tax=Actinomadura mexicana TaxID=134959 RepID=A0A239AFN8_9ACTN|nr:alpha/beta hydrolase [Actinomadura mexicana]SNR93854.1 Alpha/beta hydrolase [Actinomadura mexicana]